MVLSDILGFVDSNVLANGILAFNAIKEVVAQTKPEQQEGEMAKLWEKYAPSEYANLLFSVLREGRFGKRILATSNLALLEVTGVIAQEYRSKKLHEAHVPFRNWLHAMWRTDLSQSDYYDIRNGARLFLKSLNLRGTRLKMTNRYDLTDAMELVTEHSCDARDAILVACALKSHSRFFITEDDRLRGRLKNHSRIKAINTQDFLSGTVTLLAHCSWCYTSAHKELAHFADIANFSARV